MGQTASSPFRDQWPVSAIFSVMEVPGLPEARAGKSGRSPESSALPADSGREVGFSALTVTPRTVSAYVDCSFFLLNCGKIHIPHSLTCMQAC